MMFRTAIISSFLLATSTVLAEPVSTCYDYTEVLELGPTGCTQRTLFLAIRNAFNVQRNLPDAEGCRGGIKRDIMTLTGTTEWDAAYKTLQDMCDSALADATDEAQSNIDTWKYLENEPHKIGLEDFFDGTGFLNTETGNFQQDESRFIKRGGYERFLYVGDDPRENDHYPTSEQSFQGGEAIRRFYEKEAKESFLSPPTLGLEGSCQASNTAVCCWHRDRQYDDRNGNCDYRDCANQNPGDNTDLCWTEDNGKVFPYPGGETEQDMHCHGFSWGLDESGSDVNTNAKWNNLFFVSMYDHMYQRGYVESITNDAKIAGEQAMCGCVEDMAPVARADCTEAIGRTNYTAYQDEESGLFVVERVPDTFQLEFRACEGYNYVDDFGPEEYAENPDAEDLQQSNNDLAAFVFRQYLEGKIDEDHVNTVEETIIGYRNPDVNNGDAERNAACKAAFEDRFPGEPFVEREIEEVVTI